MVTTRRSARNQQGASQEPAPVPAEPPATETKRRGKRRATPSPELTAAAAPPDDAAAAAPDADPPPSQQPATSIEPSTATDQPNTMETAAPTADADAAPSQDPAAVGAVAAAAPAASPLRPPSKRSLPQEPEPETTAAPSPSHSPEPSPEPAPSPAPAPAPVPAPSPKPVRSPAVQRPILPPAALAVVAARSPAVVRPPAPAPARVPVVPSPARAPVAAAAPAAVAAPAAPSGQPEQVDGFRKLPELTAALETLQARVEDSAVFLRPSPEVAAAAREAAKLLYAQASKLLLEGGGREGRAERRALRRGPAAPLPQLHTDSAFDPEQIWLQLEPATEGVVRRVRRLLRAAESLGAGPGGGVGLLTAEAEENLDKVLLGDQEDEEEEEEDEEGSEEGEEESDDGDDEDKMEEEEEGDHRAKKARRDGSKAAVGAVGKGAKDAGDGKPARGGVEDRFFRLSDLERYVEDAERRAVGGSEDADEEEGKGEEEEDDGLGMFGGDDDEDDEEGDLEDLLADTKAAAGKKGKKDKATKMRYEDFFGEGDDDEEDEDDEEGEEEGEEEEEGAGRARQRGGLLSSGEGEEEEEEEAEGEARRRSGKDAGPRLDGPAGVKKGAKRAAEDVRMMSSHERRLARLQERVAELEATALSDKPWHLGGEVSAAHRPINSALEVDMDFETTAKPAPVQTVEMTNDIEALIRKRIADKRFDDVVRVVPPPLDTRTKEIAPLDDTKSKAGLGELYEQDYVRQVTGGTAEDKDEKLRAEARSLFIMLCGKLDALSRFHFAPKPVVEDMTVRVEVPAIAMEEAAPVAVSRAAMQLPSEVYAPTAKDGKPVAEGELTREDRKQRRAKKKRVRRAQEDAKESERRARAVAAGGTAEVVGRKSDSKVVAGKGVKVLEGAGASRHGRTDLGNSSAVFAKLAAEQQAAAAGGGVGAKVARELKKAGGDDKSGASKGGAALKL